MYAICVVFFFQAEDGIRDLVRSRGLDVYKRQVYGESVYEVTGLRLGLLFGAAGIGSVLFPLLLLSLALIHIWRSRRAI